MDQVVVREASLYRPKPGDLPAFLPYACGQLEAPFGVTVLLHPLEEYVSKANEKNKKIKRDKTPTQSQISSTHCSSDKQETAAVVVSCRNDEVEVIINMMCDTEGRPVELLFYHCTQLPRLLMKIIGLCIPYNMQLAKITIRWGPLDGFVLYEIAKFLPLSQITEICLDDSPVPHRNYCLLLEQQSPLISLSLARCYLVDEDVVAIASKLLHPLPASRTLATLSLEANIITDVGAHALGEALRTNRSLRHLNLAGNLITNLGASYIFRSLIEFPISFDELTLRRKRTMEYLKIKRETYEKLYKELTTPTETTPSDCGRVRRKSTAARARKSSTYTLAPIKSSAAEAIAYRAEMMANELMGSLSEPFGPAETVMHDELVYCKGNFSLCYLNLAFNNLECHSAEQLTEVVEYQARVARGAAGGPKDSGLIRAVLEGNPLAAECAAARKAAEGLERAVASFDAPQIKPGRKSERAKFKTS